jgi:hypothetical protein
MRGRIVPQPPQSFVPLAFVLVAGLGLAACNPTVKVEAPDKPIVINLNVKIEQEVRVKVDKDVENLVQTNPTLF